MRRWLNFLLSALFAAFSLWIGISIPSYFRSVAPVVLEAAGDGSPSSADWANRLLGEGQPGLAFPFISIMEASPEKDDLNIRYRQLLKKESSLQFSGGSDPYYDQFIAIAPFLNPERTQVIPTLLPPENRQILLQFLEQSLNTNVQRILQTRSISDWVVFLPVFSKAGQPLDATILTTALLEQSSAFSSPLRNELLSLFNTSDVNETLRPDQLERLESAYAAILNLGSALRWSQLKSLMGKTHSFEQLLQASTYAKKSPESFNLFLASLTAVDSTNDLFQYLRKYPERGWQGIEFCLQFGTDSFNTLFELNNPPFSPPAFWDKLPAFVTNPQTSFMGFAAEFPQLSLILRALAFAACGYFLVNLLRTLLFPRKPRDSGKRLLINLDSFVGGILVMFFIWIIIEPGLLEFRPNEQGKLSLNLASFLPQSSTENESKTTDMIDQVTIIVLVIFFVLQLLVFIFSLLKLSEIKRQNVSTETKLRLLDNEENLFDLGLYVGLGGTVFSLIMVVLNFVDASLMAAYASTLFGIIFVGSLKIGFLRPLKRSLILTSK